MIGGSSSLSWLRGQALASIASAIKKSQLVMQSIGAFIFLLFTLATASAASIDVKRLDNGSALVVIDGDFEASDIDTFRAKVAALTTPRVVVAFHSDGGNLVAGIRIGGIIREKKFTTVVPDGASCASACALAWLGGARRLVGQDASVGFHSAYILKSYGPVESSSGNAILGAYLNQLGLSENAILYITKASPTSIQWMSLDDAAENGIAVAPLSPDQTAPAAVAAHGGEGSPERHAADFVRSLVDQWGRPSAEVMPILASLYADTVVFEGKSTPRQEVLRSKQRIADRWTERSYSIRPGSLSTTCAKSGTTCRVKGVMSFRLYNAKNSNRSRGLASFDYRVDLGGQAPQIIAESRSVHEPATASRLEKAKRDFQQLLAKVSKLIP
jgi:hypothetical protein